MVCGLPGRGAREVEGSSCASLTGVGLDDPLVTLSNSVLVALVAGTGSRVSVLICAPVWCGRFSSKSAPEVYEPGLRSEERRMVQAEWTSEYRRAGRALPVPLPPILGCGLATDNSSRAETCCF